MEERTFREAIMLDALLFIAVIVGAAVLINKLFPKIEGGGG